jgi:hypothetical protein
MKRNAALLRRSRKRKRKICSTTNNDVSGRITRPAIYGILQPKNATSSGSGE